LRQGHQCPTDSADTINLDPFDDGAQEDFDLLHQGPGRISVKRRTLSVRLASYRFIICIRRQERRCLGTHHPRHFPFRKLRVSTGRRGNQSKIVQQAGFRLVRRDFWVNRLNDAQRDQGREKPAPPRFGMDPCDVFAASLRHSALNWSNPADTRQPDHNDAQRDRVHHGNSRKLLGRLQSVSWIAQRWMNFLTIALPLRKGSDTDEGCCSRFPTWRSDAVPWSRGSS